MFLIKVELIVNHTDLNMHLSVRATICLFGFFDTDLVGCSALDCS